MLSFYKEEIAMNAKSKKVKQRKANNKEIIVLNNTQRDLFIEALNNPPKPNEELKSLFH